MGLFKSIGGFLNDITGATSAAQNQYANSKEFAQNAHQWEVQDLKKAGFNPALTTGASSAGSIAGTSTGGQQSGVNPFTTIQEIAGTINQTKQTSANTNQAEASKNLMNAQAYATLEKLGLEKKQIMATIKELGERTKFTRERSRGKTTAIDISGGNKWLNGKISGLITR